MTSSLEIAKLAEREAAARVVWARSLDLPIATWSSIMLSMNDRLSPHPKAEKTKEWRKIGGLLASGAPKLKRGKVVVYFRLPKQAKGVRTVREVANLAPVIKALVDGLVDAGVFPDDGDAFVIGQDARRLPGVATDNVEIVITVWA